MGAGALGDEVPQAGGAVGVLGTGLVGLVFLGFSRDDWGEMEATVKAFAFFLAADFSSIFSM